MYSGMSSKHTRKNYVKTLFPGKNLDIVSSRNREAYLFALSANLAIVNAVWSQDNNELRVIGIKLLLVTMGGRLCVSPRDRPM